MNDININYEKKPVKIMNRNFTVDGELYFPEEPRKITIKEKLFYSRSKKQIGSMIADYLTGNFTYDQLSEKYNTAKSTISYHFKRRGIKILGGNSRYEKDYPYWEVLRYEKGKTYEEIERATGVNKATICHYFNKIRPKREKERKQEKIKRNQALSPDF